MYQVEAWSALRRARRDAGGGFRWFHVRRNVWALGFTSLFTDVSSEMVGTVLPVYLVLYLGLTPFQFGIVDGLYHGVTALLRLASGVAVDRGGRAKEIAFAGYGTSTVCRLGLLAAGVSWPLIAGVVALDRAAKGARAVPRDVLISLSSRPGGLATAFGVHRALDSAGAMLGPLVALAILAALPNAFDVVFVTSFSAALVGLGVLALFVANVERPATSTPAPGRSLSGPPRAGAPLAGGPPAAAPPVPPDAAALPDAAAPAADQPHATTPLAAARRILADPALLRLTVAASLLGAVTISDGFLYLLLQREAGFSPGLFPLLYVGTSGCYLLLAVPAGGLADRIGRQRAFLAGYGLLAGAYVTAMQPEIGVAGVAACLVLLGGHYALTDGVLMAFASGRLPPVRRGSGLALLTTATSLARLLASVLFGVLWTRYGVETAVPVFLVGLGTAIAIAVVVLRDAGRAPGR